MTDIAENLSMIGRRAYENASPFRVRRVVAVTDTVQVAIDVGDGATEDVPCLSSYRNRAAGDRVWMCMTDERGWIVLGRIGPEDQLSTNITPIPLPLPLPADPTFDDPEIPADTDPTDDGSDTTEAVVDQEKEGATDA